MITPTAFSNGHAATRNNFAIQSFRILIASLAAGAILFTPALAPEHFVTSPAKAVAQPTAEPILGSELSSRIAALTAPYASLTPPGPVAMLDDVRSAAEVSRQVTALLASAGDRRGVFGIGLDTVEESAVIPFEDHSSQWAQALSANLIYRYLSAVHAEFSGGNVPAHWARYFDAAKNGGEANSADKAALAGYNAHLSVDLALAVADAGSTPANYQEFLAIVGAIAGTADEMVARTRMTFHINLAPLWTAASVAVGTQGTSDLVRIGDQAFSSISFANGLGLQHAETRGTSRAAIDSLWQSADKSIHAADAGH